MAPMRVIAGKAKGRKLKLAPGHITRPITDRVKESLFNIIRMELPGGSFLDIFAGTGSVGIEALSQGAKYVRFVEINRTAVSVIKENLDITGLTEGAEILQMDAFALLKKTPDHQFDYLFVAPPQYKNMWKKTLLAVDELPEWLVDDGWIIVQIDPKEYEKLDLKHFSEFDRRKYGRTMLVFYERELNEE
jgi:16S rRNA (guanine(966)-N(2))-methyltransferase RsmD